MPVPRAAPSRRRLPDPVRPVNLRLGTPGYMAAATRYTRIMDVFGYLALVGLVFCLGLPFLHAWAWCLDDVRRDTTLDPSTRARWVGALVLLSVVAIPMYVSSGPGGSRWDRKQLWWPWRR